MELATVAVTQAYANRQTKTVCRSVHAVQDVGVKVTEQRRIAGGNTKRQRFFITAAYVQNGVDFLSKTR